MRTTERRAVLRLSSQRILPTADPLEVVAGLRPALERLRTGQWQLMVVGCASARERDEASMLQCRLLDLADALEGRR